MKKFICWLIGLIFGVSVVGVGSAYCVCKFLIKKPNAFTNWIENAYAFTIANWIPILIVFVLLVSLYIFICCLPDEVR